MPIAFYLQFQGYRMTQLVSEFRDRQPHLLDQRFSKHLHRTMKRKQTMRKDFTLVITRQIHIETQDKWGKFNLYACPLVCFFFCCLCCLSGLFFFNLGSQVSLVAGGHVRASCAGLAAGLAEQRESEPCVGRRSGTGGQGRRSRSEATARRGNSGRREEVRCREEEGVLWREEKLHRCAFMVGGRRRRVAVGLRAVPREPTAQ
jgi:hypothetical protein